MFNIEAFYIALDQIRKDRSLTWRAISRETEVSASTLTRMSQGLKPDLDGMASLIAWSGLDANIFIQKNEAQRSLSMLPEMTALLCSDPMLTLEAREQLINIIECAYKMAAKLNPSIP